MIKNHTYIFCLLILGFLVSCTPEKKNSTIHFGGKIVNPKGDFVVLFKQDNVVDTISLSDNNTFLKEFTTLAKGLYYFKHGDEHQYMYLEPNDSILIRLNTWNFDETLVFSGLGSSKNNALIECFLQYEKDYKTFYKYNKLSPTKFRHKVDSTLEKKAEKLSDFKTANPEISEDFMELYKLALNYPIYRYVEDYPVKHKKKLKLDSLPQLPTNFYKHRAVARTDLDSLLHFYAYNAYFYRKIKSEVERQIHSNTCDNYIVALLNSVDKHVATEDTKNNLLKRELLYNLYQESTCGLNKAAFHRFFELSTNIEDKKQVQRLLNDSKKLKLHSTLQNFTLTNFNGGKEYIHDLIKGKNSVIYFWNEAYTTPSFLASKVKHLQQKNPKVKFIIIKYGKNHKNYTPYLDIKLQYFIDSSNTGINFLTSKLPRTLLINKKGKIENGFASISSPKIFKQIKDLQK